MYKVDKSGLPDPMEKRFILFCSEITESGFDSGWGQACDFTEATKAIASVSPVHCLGALEMLQYKFAISS